jgi:hypothetical protein
MYAIESVCFSLFSYTLDPSPMTASTPEAYIELIEELCRKMTVQEWIDRYEAVLKGPR